MIVKTNNYFFDSTNKIINVLLFKFKLSKLWEIYVIYQFIRYKIFVILYKQSTVVALTTADREAPASNPTLALGECFWAQETNLLYEAPVDLSDSIH